MDEISFLSEIEKEVHLQEEAILRRAEEAGQKILEDARKEAARLEETLLHRTEAEIRKQRSRAFTQGALENRRALLALKSEFVDKALGAARDTFDSLRTGRDYQSILKKFLSELVKMVDEGRKVIVRVSPEDEKAARILLGELSLKAELRAEPSISRGLELEDGEGRLRIRNTFDSRLRQAHEEIVQSLNKILFQGINV